MKRCPSCNRAFTHATQKFCTQDGTLLVDAPASPGQGETIRIDSAQLQSTQIDDETTKPISRELTSRTSGAFDPYQTMVNEPRREKETSDDEFDLTLPASPPRYSESPPATVSGPIPPPPIPPPTRPLEAPPSGSLSPSAPPRRPMTQAYAPQPSAPAPSPSAPVSRPAKQSRLPLVLGLLAVLFLIGAGVAVAGYLLVLRPMLETKRVIADHAPSPSPTPAAISKLTSEPKTIKEVPPYSPPADALEFVSSSDNLDGKLKEHYVDFSFYYPESWQRDPNAGVPGASNFAKVERRLPPDATQENFAVGWYSSAGSEEGDRAVFHTLAENLSAQYQKNFPEYRKVSEGPTTVGVYDGYQFRFESVSRNTDKGDIKIWGRVIFLPPVDGGKNGVTLLMLATSLAPELKSVNDVGVKGELPMMLQSFRFGK